LLQVRCNDKEIGKHNAINPVWDLTMNNPVGSAGQGQKNYYNPGRVERNTNKQCQHIDKFSAKEDNRTLIYFGRLKKILILMLFLFLISHQI